MRVQTMMKQLFVIRSIFRIFPALLIMAGLLNPIMVNADDPVRVIVLPLTINATKDLNYLSAQIANVLADQLKQDGATIVTMAP